MVRVSTSQPKNNQHHENKGSRATSAAKQDNKPKRAHVVTIKISPEKNAFIKKATYLLFVDVQTLVHRRSN